MVQSNNHSYFQERWQAVTVKIIGDHSYSGSLWASIYDHSTQSILGGSEQSMQNIRSRLKLKRLMQFAQNKREVLIQNDHEPLLTLHIKYGNLAVVCSFVYLDSVIQDDGIKRMEISSRISSICKPENPLQGHDVRLPPIARAIQYERPCGHAIWLEKRSLHAANVKRLSVFDPFNKLRWKNCAGNVEIQ